MPIHQGILKKYAEKHVLVMQGDQTLKDAQQQFQESGYPLNDTYLVVSLPDNRYLVEHAFNLDQESLGDQSTQPLSSLPLSEASRVVHVDTSESGKSIVNWVTTTPNSTLVVIDDNGFVGLLANTDMGISKPEGLSVLEKKGDQSGKQGGKGKKK